ncbi:hypothetical protein [Breoghania sp. L-A4]|uniref:hypothetical protein n=1 Tax=Breoghania sp. L-A4 TaxID=2304600 RepID=UPI000E35BE18|nr:hypothetical protein [Breoghania sp. L-A4]AXS40875.1 hypothetical protein D1F64_13550 [Breoghania sp. L-A4]
MLETRPAEPDIFAQIEALGILGDGPLVICDVDEVVLHFIAPLEAYMVRCGFELIEPRFMLTGNIRRLDGGGLASQDEVRALIHGFFETESESQKPVPHASDTLAALSAHAQVLMLTNMPERFRPAREGILRRNAIPYPVLTNIGPKGPAVATLAGERREPIFFLDDSAGNVTSVRDHVDSAHLIHFIADARFFALAEPIDGVHHRSNCWRDTRRYIEGVLGI